MKHLLALVLVLAASIAAAGQSPPAANSCLACHSSLAEERLAAPARTFVEHDVHRERGFACVDCHGGNASAAEAARGHDRARGFRGRPAAGIRSKRVRAATAMPS